MTDEKKWMVYCHTNKLNGKKYIGITSEKYPSHRFHRGEGYKSCTVFYRAIKKYGWDSFETEILFRDLSKDDAFQMEYNLVKAFGTRNPKLGYNMIDGGIAPKPLSPEGRESLRKAATGTNNPGARSVVVFNLDGKKLNEFPCIVFAERHYGIYINRTHLKNGRGTCHNLIFRYKDEVGDIEQLPPDQVYQRCEQKLVRGENSWHSTPVTVFDAVTGEFVKSFSCAKYANELIGANCSNNLRGKTKSVMGYVCKLSSDVVGVTKLPPESLPQYEITGKAVNQYDLDGNFIQTFPNATIAERITGVNRKNISNCVRKQSYIGGGYLWKLASDDSPLRKPMTAYESAVANGIKNGKSVDQIDLKTGKVVATYLSIGQAAQAMGCAKNSISIVVNQKGNCRSCKGYGWRFHEGQN